MRETPARSRVLARDKTPDRRLVGWLAAASLCAALVGCDSSSSARVSGTPRADIESALRMEEDCLYYRVATGADGIETWNADYVYFYVLEEGRPAMDENKEPIGQGLLFSQLEEFMKHHSRFGADTQLTFQVSRQVQRVLGDSVVSLEPPVIIPVRDLDSLLTAAGR